MIFSDPVRPGSMLQGTDLSDQSPTPEEETVWLLACELAGAVSPSAVASAVAEHGAVVAGATFANMGIREAGSDVIRVVITRSSNRTMRSAGGSSRWTIGLLSAR